MTTRRRDLGTRGRVLVAAVAVGSAGVLAGWMAATDHTSATASDATSSTPAVSGSNNDSSSGSSGSSGSSSSSSQQGSGDDRNAVPGSPQASSSVPDGRTGGS